MGTLPAFPGESLHGADGCGQERPWPQAPARRRPREPLGSGFLGGWPRCQERPSAALLDLREVRAGILGKAGGVLSEGQRVGLKLRHSATGPAPCGQEWQAGPLSGTERSLEGALKTRQLSRNVLPMWAFPETSSHGGGGAPSPEAAEAQTPRSCPGPPRMPPPGMQGGGVRPGRRPLPPSRGFRAGSVLAAAGPRPERWLRTGWPGRAAGIEAPPPCNKGNGARY